jgi:dihydrofolate reductase
MGYVEFIDEIDALLMGRKTFETVLGFDIDWPYNKPVFVLSDKLTEIPESHKEKAFLVNGALTEILDQIHEKGLNRLYIDGGTTIQNFLKEDLIDEMVLSIIPILLGGGSSLFAELPNELEFELIGTKTYLNQITQNHYKRRKTK